MAGVWGDFKRIGVVGSEWGSECGRKPGRVGERERRESAGRCAGARIGVNGA